MRLPQQLAQVDKPGTGAAHGLNGVATPPCRSTNTKNGKRPIIASLRLDSATIIVAERAMVKRRLTESPDLRRRGGALLGVLRVSEASASELRIPMEVKRLADRSEPDLRIAAIRGWVSQVRIKARNFAPLGVDALDHCGSNRSGISATSQFRRGVDRPNNG